MVKLHWLMSLAAAGLFTACSQDELVKDAGNDTGLDGVQEISLMVDNGGDNFGSRGGRPLYSHEANQNIDEVYVWIVKNTGKPDGVEQVVACTTIKNWNDTSTSTIYNEGSHGRKYNKRLILGKEGNTDMPKLSAGDYTIYALGRTIKESSYGQFTLPAKGTPFNATKFTLTSSTGNGEEIFATATKVNVAEKGNGNFIAKVILNRQVAGFYAYLSNIPYDKAMSEAGADPVIKIVASQNKNTLLGFGKFANQDLANNGSNAAMYVVNGATPHTSDNVICTIHLNKWFKKIQDVDKDGLIDIDTKNGNPENPTTANNNFDNWQNAYEKDAANFTKGSVFGGVFVIPFQNITNNNTLTMQLCTGNTQDERVVETWNITLSKGLNTTKQLFAWTENTGISEKQIEAETKNNYSIYRNHLYAIGSKAWDKNPDTIDPGTDPDPDPTNPTDPNNKPLPINKTQELTLQVCDNWEVLHEMELE